MEGRGELYTAAALLQDETLVPTGQEVGGGGGGAEPVWMLLNM